MKLLDRDRARGRAAWSLLLSASAAALLMGLAAGPPTSQAEPPPEATEPAETPWYDEAGEEEEPDPDQPPESLRSVFGYDREEQTPWYDQRWKPEDIVAEPSFTLTDYLTGPWFGAREWLYDRGIDLRGEYLMEAAGNPAGGLSRGVTYVHNVGMQLLIDLEKGIRWPGAMFRTKYSQRSGKSLTKEEIGNDFQVQQLFGPTQNNRLVNLQLIQSLWSDRINVSVGRIVYVDDFQYSPLHCQFVNNAFCGAPVAVFRNVPDGATVYPTATWGARVRARPTADTYVMAAAYDGDPTQGGSNDNGTNMDFGDNGVFWGFEMGYVPARGLLNLPASYKLGGWYHSGKFDDLAQDVNGDNKLITGLPARQHRGNGAVYININQTLYRERQGDPQGLIFFLDMYVGVEKKINTLPFFYDVGAVYTGLIPGRPRDQLAFGAAGGTRRDRLRNAQREAGEEVTDVEVILELNYQIEVTRFFYVRPDLQYIINPDGRDSIQDAFVMGLELGFRF